MGWNTRVIPFLKFRSFLHDVEGSVPWSILLLQEFLDGKLKEPPEQLEGHPLYTSSPRDGARWTGILLNRSASVQEVGEPIKTPHAVAIKVKHAFYGHMLVGAIHLHPGNDRRKYLDTIEEMGTLLEGNE